MIDQSRPKALVFDVNETLLDLSHVQKEFQDIFGEEYAFKFTGFPYCYNTPSSIP